ncbi:MAG TPA: lytic transglycosylase domain-containing protein [Sphingobacteriaceae bacterium]|nr:lytic transglycosylase domain-containing protein [Sphingobacteriaceae bacterium]
MNKKHLITCLMLLGLISSAKLLLNSSPAQASAPHHTFQDSFDAANPYKKILASGLGKQIEFNYSFANENLPAESPGILTRMKKMLTSYTFNTMQTTHLHRNAAKWFPVVVPILRAYGIPDDFKYVPLVESGFEAGTSSKGASGYWQFMPATARGFGLKVNGDVDERHNVRKSTVAACKYIKSLYKEFGSWTLVAAAYNIGGNSLKRHMSSQNEDNYFKMKLNRETATYVYRLMSMKEIIEKPRLYGYFHKNPKLIASSTVPRKRKMDPEVERKALMALSLLRN